MDEQSARHVLLVRALETDNAPLISEDDRRHAARAAAELTRWHASSKGIAATDDMFIARRAELLLQQLATREPRVSRAMRAFEWRPLLGIALPAAALLFGLLAEQITDRQRVNLLAFPLAALIVWNLIIYVLLTARALFNRRGAANPFAGALRRWLVAASERRPRFGAGPLGGALSSFAAAWMLASAPLQRARAARVLHLAAAAVGIGMVIGLYARGLVFDYRVGWESTFLDAAAVHAILSVFLAPAAWLLSMPLPEPQTLQALRFDSGTIATASAAPWIHLYAASVAIWVIVPRLALALVAGAIERRRRNHFRLDLSEPYYRRLLGAFGEHVVRVRVVPYSYRIDENAAGSLRAIARALFGERAEVDLRPVIEVGGEARADEGLVRTDPAVPLTIALFSLAATPENESHGALLDRLREQLASPVAVLIDEAPLRTRFEGSGEQRIDERRRTWQTFCSQRGVQAALIDLRQPDVAQVEREWSRVLAQ